MNGNINGCGTKGGNIVSDLERQVFTETINDLFAFGVRGEVDSRHIELLDELAQNFDKVGQLAPMICYRTKSEEKGTRKAVDHWLPSFGVRVRCFQTEAFFLA